MLLVDCSFASLLPPSFFCLPEGPAAGSGVLSSLGGSLAFAEDASEGRRIDLILLQIEGGSDEIKHETYDSKLNLTQCFNVYLLTLGGLCYEERFRSHCIVVHHIVVGCLDRGRLKGLSVVGPHLRCQFDELDRVV